MLAALAGDTAVLSLGGARRDVAVADLSRGWFGDYVLLWRAGTQEPKPLAPGARGAPVQNLQRSLRTLAGLPVAGAPTGVYDAELMRQVADFQRAHRLEPDGIASIATQVMIDSALPAESPRLVVARADAAGA